ncbi:MAG: hypothetical protein J6I42_01520 [Clostridia bacterium]|nr:hypothetical protein [Clostridia bacterium]
MILTDTPKLNILCGHYGSGKTNLAVNLALDLRNRNPGLTIYAADLDIVNPYFRTADAAEILRAANVEPLIPEFANTNVDIPSLPPKMMGMIRGDYSDAVSILDVGGDDGAVVLGMYSRFIRQTGYDMYYVINQYRPLTAAPEDVYFCMRDIEAASGLTCTKIINNSSLGAETTAEDVADSVDYAHECAAKCGLPLVCHAYCPEYAPDTPDVFRQRGYGEEPLFAIRNVTKRLF